MKVVVKISTIRLSCLCLRQTGPADKLMIACSHGLVQPRNYAEIIGTGRERQQQCQRNL